ncbi:MAG TPA: APC family permease [Bryobacteraceae bacterium]|nr:APC family permease [Bryobacteraceae bacterium]
MTTRASSNSAAPAFRRVLSRWDLILYGLVFLSPTAPYPVYGLIQKASHGHATLAYLVAMVAMLFTAASYGKMAGAYPSAGSTYTYACKSLNEYVGFLAGWAMILDYCLVPLLSIIYSALTAARLVPGVPYWVWAVLFTVGITAVNLRGIRVTARASEFLMFVMSVCAALFVVAAARWVILHHGAGGLFSAEALFRPESFGRGPLMLGAGIAALSYLGFDAISTLAEDTVKPERDIAVATVAACVLQTVFCVATVYLATLVWPDYRSFPDAETAILDVGRRAGGEWLLGSVSFVLLVAGLASAITGQAGASRLLFGMGRDGVISSRIFAHLDRRYSTPSRSIYLMGAVSLVCSLAMQFQTAVEIVNFGAFVGFILVNLSVIRTFYLQRRERTGWGLVSNLIFPAIGAAVAGYVWMSLSVKATLAGFIWLGIGTVYLALLTRGFRRAPKPIEFVQENS